MYLGVKVVVMHCLVFLARCSRVLGLPRRLAYCRNERFTRMLSDALKIDANEKELPRRRVRARLSCSIPIPPGGMGVRMRIERNSYV